MKLHLKQSLVLGISILAGAETGSCKSHGNLGDLRLDRTSGPAPIMVTVVAPQDLLDVLKIWQRNKGQHSNWGDGFSVDWGDGFSAGDGGRRGGQDQTSQNATHTYTKPGTYHVSAMLYDFMPDDSHKTYWTGTTTVTVN